MKNIPGLMHEAIDSSLFPVHCLHFKESVEAGRRGRRAGGRRGTVYERKEEGGLPLTLK